MVSRLRSFMYMRKPLFDSLNVKKLMSRKQNYLFYATNSSTHSNTGRSFFKKAPIIIGCVGIGTGMYSYLAAPNRENRSEQYTLVEKKPTIMNDIPEIKPSREVSGPASNLGLDFTLYQYQTCPFCCKVRSFLDFHGVPYKVIEVNPVMRQQLKFSTYKKVPILIVQEKGSSTKYQLNDSSVIISILGTLLLDVDEGLEKVLQYYVPVTYKDAKGKEVEEVMNKYFLMYGEKALDRNSDSVLAKERQWRKWADKELVHILSPNIYRTYDEALQAFNYFSEVGEWEKNFSTLERLVVIYVGATAMYLIGKKLKKKHALKEDVRESLYDACKLWMKEIGSKRKFMGGDMPNLADLAVYGLLNSIEGCVAFQDLLNNTNIGTWYYNTKEAITSHSGYHLLR